MTTPTPITYEAMQTRAGDLRRVDRAPRSTRRRSTGATRRLALASRLRLRVRTA